jgi:hypothetical protein
VARISTAKEKLRPNKKNWVLGFFPPRKAAEHWHTSAINNTLDLHPQLKTLF